MWPAKQGCRLRLPRLAAASAVAPLSLASNPPSSSSSWRSRSAWSPTRPSDPLRRHLPNRTSSSAAEPPPPPPPPPVIEIDPRVRRALQAHRPVVALESTIVAHGMPHPQNYELASRVEALLRSTHGVEPATVALKNGAVRVGLSDGELRDLAAAGGQGRAHKCSNRELSLFLASNGTHSQSPPGSSPLPRWGATTVASTMHLAHLASIPTFVTGGIGGVHRGGEQSMDVSTDLLELARTPVVVVCAGIKSILDVRKTLEVLETHGVPVVTYRSDEFPAFFSPHSGVRTPARVDDVEEVARAYWAARDLGLSHGMLVAAPNHDPAGEEVEDAIQSALREAAEQGVSGPAITPFVLRRVAETTSGDSLRSNMALVENNASVGAGIARAISEIAKERQRAGTCGPAKVYATGSSAATSRARVSAPTPRSRVVVLGGVVLDVVAKPHNDLILGTSNPGSCVESDGGVGRNIAEVLGRLGDAPLLYSAVGDDSRGLAILRRLREDCGVLATADSVRVVPGANTASYMAVLQRDGDLHVACADMDVLALASAPPREVLQNTEALVLDANLPVQILREAAETAARVGAAVFLDPTSVPKARLIAQDENLLSSVSAVFPNLDELVAMATWTAGDAVSAHDESTNVEALAVALLSRLNPRGPAQVIATLGENGVFLASRESALSPPTLQVFPPEPGVTVVNATGAGDTLCGAYVHAILQGNSVMEAVEVGMIAAARSLASSSTIAPDLAVRL
jgi:pseudouridine-5'-phosphate glycosidase/sugar/nucleoside kinase (ribokinase family)